MTGRGAVAGRRAVTGRSAAACRRAVVAVRTGWRRVGDDDEGAMTVATAFAVAVGGSSGASRIAAVRRSSSFVVEAVEIDRCAAI